MTSDDRKPFELGSGDRAVLLIHGFTGTPFEMKYLGRRLADRGFRVVGALLPGHGATSAALDATTWRDWAFAVDREIERLRTRSRRLAVVGMSLGGLLTLHAATRAPDLAAIGVLGVPLWLPRQIMFAARGVRWLGARGIFLPPVPKIGGSDVSDAEVRKLNPSLHHFPLAATASLAEFSGIVRAEVPDVHVPTFVAHADHDHVAPPACSRELVARLGTRDVRFLQLPRSFHIVTIDVERDQVADELGAFLSERMA